MFYERHANPQNYLPILLLSFTFVLYLAFEVVGLHADSVTLAETYAQQKAVIVQAQKSQERASALIKGLMELSRQGNPQAQAILTEMEKAGVNFEKPPAHGSKMEALPPAAPPEARKAPPPHPQKALAAKPSPAKKATPPSATKTGKRVPAFVAKEPEAPTKKTAP